VKRREFIAGLGSSAAAWPRVARAQQADRVRQIGVLTGAGEAGTRVHRAQFLQTLQQLGWIEGRNIRIDYRWGGGDANTIRKYAAELAALAPDVIVAVGAAAAPTLQETRTVPIVFVLIPDPVGAGFVDSLARPGGNATGFMQFEYSLSGKWLELLKEIAPRVTRAGVLRDAATTAGIGQFAAIQSAATSLGIDVSPLNIRDIPEIERAITGLARSGNGGLIVTLSAFTVVHREPIVASAARHKLPTIYSNRDFVTIGGLIAYGANYTDQYRRAAGYVDRILKGEKPADLPCRLRQSTICSSISGRRRTSGSPYRRQCSRAPTR